MALWLKNTPAKDLDGFLTKAIDELKPVEKPSMSITGLQSGAFQAKLAEMRKKMSDIQTAGLAEIDAAVTQGAAELDAAAKSAAAKAKSEVADALQEFAKFTNG